MAFELLFWVWVEFVKAFWLLFPAYAANMYPPLSHGTHPIDGKRVLGDGRRIFGDGKTWEGLALGVGMGALVGGAEFVLWPSLNVYAQQLGGSLPPYTLPLILLIPLGALVGDMCGSFLKRRLGLERGADLPFMDQLNFIVGALVFGFLFTEISWGMVAVMLVVTPVLHRAVNIIGFKLKEKAVPW